MGCIAAEHCVSVMTDRRGAVGCATELASGTRPWAGKGWQPPYVDFCLKMVAMLRSHGVTPVVSHRLLAWFDTLLLLEQEALAQRTPALLDHPTNRMLCALQLVFDGDRLPAKAQTNLERRERKQV